MIHVTCRLTAKNRDQLRNHTLGNRVWAIFNVSQGSVQATHARCGYYVASITPVSWRRAVSRRYVDAAVVRQPCWRHRAKPRRRRTETPAPACWEGIPGPLTGSARRCWAPAGERGRAGWTRADCGHLPGSWVQRSLMTTLMTYKQQHWQLLKPASCNKPIAGIRLRFPTVVRTSNIK